MSAKVILVFCAQALFVQSVLSQCACGLRGYSLGGAYRLDGAYGLGSAYGLARGYGLGGAYGFSGPGIDISPTSGGGLPVSSASAIAPVGLSIASENIYGGVLAAAGELPFVGTVGIEGVMPTAGVGAVHHACGDGINAMVSEGVGYNGAYGLGLGVRGLGYRDDLRGCGCGL